MTDRNVMLEDAEVDISIIVVTFNTRRMTLECLRSIIEQTRDVTCEIIVVDNRSEDGSADAIRSEFRDVRLIGLDENLGFARANNLAAKGLVAGGSCFSTPTR